MNSQYLCKICKKEFTTDAAMTRHLFLSHADTYIKILPIRYFEMLNRVLMDEFLDLWKLVVRKRRKDE